MAIRSSKRMVATESKLEPIPEMLNRIIELETVVTSVKQLLEISRLREKKLALALEDFGVNVSLVIDLEAGSTTESISSGNFSCPLEPQITFVQSPNYSNCSLITSITSCTHQHCEEINNTRMIP